MHISRFSSQQSDAVWKACVDWVPARRGGGTAKALFDARVIQAILMFGKLASIAPDESSDEASNAIRDTMARCSFRRERHLSLVYLNFALILLFIVIVYAESTSNYRFRLLLFAQ
jgi:hypothetical protein